MFVITMLLKNKAIMKSNELIYSITALNKKLY